MIETALIDAARILDGSPVPTFVIDAEHVVVYWNEALARMSGIQAAEVLGTPQQWRAFYPAHRPVLADLVVDGAPTALIEKFYRDRYQPSAHCPGGWDSEDFFPHLGAAGRWLAFSAAPIRAADGRVVGCVETLQDISERKQADAARREAELRQEEIIAGSPVATFVLDAQCRVTHWNRACETLTGVPARQMLGSTDAWRAFYPDAERRTVLAEMIVRGASPAEFAQHYADHVSASPLVPGAFEAREFFPRFGSRGKFLHFMASPLHDGKNRVIGAIETLIEIAAPLAPA